MEILYNNHHFNFFAYFFEDTFFKLPHSQSATWFDSCCFIFRALQTLSQIKFLKYMDPSFAIFGPKLDASSRPNKRYTNTTIMNTCNCSLQIQPSLLAPTLMLRMFWRKASDRNSIQMMYIVNLEAMVYCRYLLCSSEDAQQQNLNAFVKRWIYSTNKGYL